MERIRLTAVVQIANQNTNTVKNEKVEFSLDKDHYEVMKKKDTLEDKIIDHVKKYFHLYEYEFVNRVKHYSVG